MLTIPENVLHQVTTTENHIRLRVREVELCLTFEAFIIQVRMVANVIDLFHAKQRAVLMTLLKLASTAIMKTVAASFFNFI